jgi:hypothetical protein
MANQPCTHPHDLGCAVAIGTFAKAPDGAMMASMTKAESVACAIAVAQAMTG